MFNSWQKTDINKTLDVSNFYDSFKIRHHQSTQKKSIFKNASLREKCLYLPFFWYVFWRILTEYGNPNAGKFGPEKLSSGNWNHRAQSSKNLFTITKIFYIFNVLLYGLSFEVKHSKIFYILPTSLVHPDTEKSLYKHPKIGTFKVFSQVFKQTNFSYISEKYFFLSIWNFMCPFERTVNCLLFS